MRINIKTKKPIKDKDVKALYVIGYALEKLASPRMKIPTLEFFYSKLKDNLSA